jgi:hypothetical protein
MLYAGPVRSGWSAQITPCMTDPAGAGGMGFHYGNVALIDGTARVDELELLLYEPEKNGRLRLVAVEYIIPYTLHSRAAAPPVLFGQEFKQNDTFSSGDYTHGCGRRTRAACSRAGTRT